MQAFSVLLLVLREKKSCLTLCFPVVKEKKGEMWGHIHSVIPMIFYPEGSCPSSV